MLKLLRLAALMSVITLSPSASPRRRPTASTWSPASRSSATSPRMSAATASRSPRSSDRTATRMSTSRARPTRPPMAKANVVLVNGLHFEGFLQRLVDASGTKATVVELTKGVTPIEFKPEFAEEDEGTRPPKRTTTRHGNIDPHAFQSIANARIYVANIADAFCAADAAGCDSYKANAAAYTGKLDALEGEVKDAIASIPADKRIDHHLARRLRLFRARIRPDLPRAGRHLDRGRAVGRRCRQADRPGQAGEGGGDLRREHHQPAADRADRLRDRPEDRRHALFRRAVAGRRPGLDLYRPDEEQHRHDQGRDPGELRGSPSPACGRRLPRSRMRGVWPECYAGTPLIRLGAARQSRPSPTRGEGKRGD